MSVQQAAKALLTEATLAATAFAPAAAIGTVGVIATAALVVTADAQTQTSVRLDGKDYTVTEMTTGRASRAGHMVQLAGPEGAAMVMVNNDNKITAYISPPGGGGQQPLINSVWNEYLKEKNAAAGASPAPAPDPTTDRNAALRAQAAAITAQVEGRVSGATSPASVGERVVKTLTNDSITIYDPVLKTDVTFTQDLMRATWSITPSVPAGMPVNPKTEKYDAHFEGGDRPTDGLQKSGKLLKGVGVGVADAANHSASASSTISADPDKVWSVDETTGGTKINLYQSGGMRVGGNIAYSGRDPKGDMGRNALVAVKADLDFAKAAIEAAQQDGQATAFDLNTDRFQRGTKALEAAVN